MTMAHELAAWLNTLDGTRHDATPVSVQIGRNIYPNAARYTDTVGETVIYLLGPVPRSYARRTLYAVTAPEADDMLWYVSGYFPSRPEDADNPQYAQYHPFGRMVMLRRSAVPVKRRLRDEGDHSWLTRGARGGFREIQNIRVVPLSYTHGQAPDGRTYCGHYDGHSSNQPGDVTCPNCLKLRNLEITLDEVASIGALPDEMRARREQGAQS